MQHFQNVMPRKETPVSLPKEIQRNRKQADANFHTAHNVEHIVYPVLHKPLVAAVRKAKGKEVLEDHHTREGFNRHVTCFVIKSTICRRKL